MPPLPAATPALSLADLPPVIAVHLVAALAAVVVGAVALTVRKGTPVHRGAGYTWVLLMAVTASSAVFIRATDLPNLFGFTPIHLLILTTGYGLWRGVREARRGRLGAHRRAMQITYVSACLVAGAFTLLPGRFVGDWVRQSVAMVHASGEATGIQPGSTLVGQASSRP